MVELYPEIEKSADEDNDECLCKTVEGKIAVRQNTDVVRTDNRVRKTNTQNTRLPFTVTLCSPVPG